VQLPRLKNSDQRVLLRDLKGSDIQESCSSFFVCFKFLHLIWLDSKVNPGHDMDLDSLASQQNCIN